MAKKLYNTASLEALKEALNRPDSVREVIKIEEPEPTISVDEIADEISETLDESDESIEADEINTDIEQGNDTGNKDKISIDSSENDSDAGSILSLILSAEVAILIMDSVMPNVVWFGADRLGYRADKKSLKLSVSDKKALEKPVQNFLDTIKIEKLPPWAVALLAILSVYTGKIIASPLEKKRKKIT